MTNYILIFVIMASNGVTTSSAGPFQNLDACRNAMSVVEGRFDGFLREVFTACVEDR
jgi:hypothetical protein